MSYETKNTTQDLASKFKNILSSNKGVPTHQEESRRAQLPQNTSENNFAGDIGGKNQTPDKENYSDFFSYDLSK